MKLDKKTLLKIGLSITFIFIIILFLHLTNTYAQTNDRICFSIEDSKRLVVELEKGKLLEQNIILLEKSNEELTKQTNLLKEQVQLVNDKFKTAEALVNKNEELYNQKVKVLNEELDEANKPRWGSLFGSFGLGVLMTGLLIILL